MRILIIEDEAGSAELLQMSLQDDGFASEVAATGAEALRICDARPDFGVIFLDLGLPDCDGLDLLPSLVLLVPTAEIHVLTATESFSAAVAAMNEGASGYLVKPVEMKQLLRVVARADETRQRRQQIEFQSMVLRNIQEAVIAVDRDKNITYWNHGAELLYGWTVADVFGRPLSEVLGTDAMTSEIPDAGPALVVETRRFRRDRTEVDVEERVHRLRDPMRGDDVGYLALARDVTERKQSEQRLAEAREREHNIAATFQRALLPEIPVLRPGLEIGSLYEPAWDDADVGGDFYGVLPLDNGRTGLLLGDVSGKGLSAGVLMSLIRHVLDAFSSEDDRPQEVLVRTNRHLATRIPDERFVTLFYATFDPGNESLAYASAGHEPALLYRADGTLELLPPTGPMIGLDATMDFEAAQISFRVGDTLLIYTDGATEAGAPSNILGMEGLIKIFEGMVRCPVAEITRKLYDAILEHSSGRAQDDLALLCLRAVPYR